MKKEAKVIVEQNPEATVEKKILAQAIVDISKSLQALERSGLNRKAIIALVKDNTYEHKSTIERVLNSLDDLAKNYTRS